MKAHPTAVVSTNATIDPSVEIGPFVVIEDDVTIAKGVKIYAHAYIASGTYIGENTEIHMGAVLGHSPQDLAFDGKRSFLKIGRRNRIREYVTIHRGTGNNTITEIGDDNYLMAHSHVGHNCRIGSKVVLANGALLAGYVDVEDNVFISGNVVVHQFCRIGKLAIIGGFSGVNKDVPPYMTVRGPSVVRTVNLIGLKRAGFQKNIIKEIREAFRLIYKSNLNTAQALEKILKCNPSKEIVYLADFIKNSKRGICKVKYDFTETGVYDDRVENETEEDSYGTDQSGA